jgi:hypothetical protein
MADKFFLANRRFIMKRNVFLIGMLAMALVFGMVGCGQNTSNSGKDRKEE